MAGISGLGTNYNLPNYTGILFQLTPSDTPFFSAIGGLNGGGQTTSTEFEWQTFDLRDPAQPAIVEGADAPTAQERVRANVTNVVQIHQEKVSVAYSKLAAVGLKGGTNNEAANPVRSEIDWQVEQMLKQMVRDVEYSFINGAYQKPANNSTGRKTKGLLEAITSNAFAHATALPAVTSTASTDVFASTGHGLSAGDAIMFTALTGGAGLSVNTPYFVITVPDANSFKVSAVKGGASVDHTTNITAATTVKLKDLAKDDVDNLMQSAYDNGGIQESASAVLMVNSHLKRAISAAYGLTDVPPTRNVGGVNITTIETDFGTVGVMLNRYVPKDTLIVASLEQCQPVFLEIPGKGHFFAEPLARTGAADNVQLYGEVGLAFGNEKSHAKATGLGF